MLTLLFTVFVRLETLKAKTELGTFGPAASSIALNYGLAEPRSNTIF